MPLFLDSEYSLKYCPIFQESDELHFPVEFVMNMECVLTVVHHLQFYEDQRTDNSGH